MVIVEKSFPRGGVAVKENESTKPKENIIFGALQKKIKKTKPKANKDEEYLTLDASDKKVESFSAELLNYDTIQDGMNIMGMVKAVEPLYLIIALPGRIRARVSALEISESYTKATKEFLQSAGEGEAAEAYKPLKEMYKLGQIVYARVRNVAKTKRGRTRVNLTLKPTEVHSDLVHASIKKGFIFNGAVEEVQEHGYIIETGIKGLRCFVPLEKSQQRHVVGELIFLKVEKMTPSQSVSTCICKEVGADALKVKKSVDANIDYILPTTIVQFNVTKRMRNGLQGTILNESFTGYINEHQLGEQLALPMDYELHSTLEARVLYVMPLTKLVYLSLNLHNSLNEQQQYKRGDIVENARVHHMGTGGVVLVMDNKFKGIISYKTIKMNYKGNYDQDELLNKYAKKTQHKVRVLDYDVMDSMYICTDDARVVNESIFSLDDLHPGQFVNAFVKHKKPKVGGYTLQVGKIKAIIEKCYLAPSSKTLELKSNIRCRVIAINAERRIIYLTNRPEYLAKNSKVLTSLTDARVNAVYTGTIVKCQPTYVLVKFFNHVKGVLHQSNGNNALAPDMCSFYEGQTLEFRVANKKDEQITLTLPENSFQIGEICPVSVCSTLDAGVEIKINLQVDSEDDEQLDEANTAEASKVGTVVKGLIPLRLLSDFIDLLPATLKTLSLNSDFKAVCVGKNIFSLRDVDYFRENLTKNFGSIEKGNVLKAYVKNVSDEVVELVLPIQNYTKLVKIHVKMLLMTAFRNANVVLNPDQVVYVKVLSKEPATKTIAVSAKLVDVWNGKLSTTASYMEKYFLEIESIKTAFKTQKNALGKYCLGEKIQAKFMGVVEETGDWQYEVVGAESAKSLKGIIPALIKASLLGKTKPPKVGELQECIVLWIDYSQGLLLISNKASELERISKEQTLSNNYVGKSGISAKVLLKLENVFICSLKKGNNPLIFCPKRLHYNDFEDSSSIIVKEGDFCKLSFIHEQRPFAVLEDTWKLWKTVERKRKAEEPSKMKQQEDNPQKKKRKTSESTEDEQNIAKEWQSEIKKLKRHINELKEQHPEYAKKLNTEHLKQIETKANKICLEQQDPEIEEKLAIEIARLKIHIENKKKEQPRIKEILENQHKQPKAQKRKDSDEELDDSANVLSKKSKIEAQPSDMFFFEDKTPDAAEALKAASLIKNARASTTAEKAAAPKFLSGVADFWSTDLNSLNQANNEESSDENDEPSELPQKKKKLTAAEKFRLQREEETRLRNIEERYADPNQLPETVDQFDRLVLSDPNNSKNWINYMVFHLQSTEIDKARAVARRAIKSISFRDSAEQINIWVALLNLELRYGSKESFDDILKEALTYNEPIKIYIRALDILCEAKRSQEMLEMIAVLTKKFKAEADIWKACANALFSCSMIEKAQQMLHRALACLPERDHVNTIVNFANLNYKYGENEMAQTLLDQIITSYPKRVDVWTQYVDMLIKENMTDSARTVLERAVIQKIPLKKMRTIFKKYLEFEERFGNEDNVQKVKKLAAEYVKNNAN